MINDTPETIGEKALGKAIGVSRITIWKWRRAGMPVVTCGRPGVENRYHLPAVVGWLQKTGHGQDLRAGLETGGRIQKLASELAERVTAVQTSAPGGRAAAAPASGWIAFDYKTMGKPLAAAIGIIFANSFSAACGLAVHRYKISVDQAIDIHEDMLLLTMTAAADLLGVGDDINILYPDELAGLLHPEKRSELIERIEAAAAIFRDAEKGERA